MPNSRTRTVAGKCVIVCAAMLLCLSCAPLEPWFAFLEEWNYSFHDGGLPFDSADDLCAWVSGTITYQSDAALWGAREYWASPEQTYECRKGDCEDKALLFMYFAYTRNLSSNPKLVAVQMAPNLGHAMVRIDDMYYDPTLGTGSPASAMTHPVIYSLNYGQAIYIATHSHDEIRCLAPAVPLDSP